MGCRRAFVFFSATVAIAVSCVVVVPPSHAAQHSDHGLTRYPELQVNVAFWHDVFTRYSSRQIVFHDPYHLDIIYAVRDVSHIIDGDLSAYRAERAVRDYMKTETAHLASVLRHLNLSSPSNAEARRIAAAIKAARGKVPSPSVLAKRIRAQRGLADKLCASIGRAKAYLPEMRRILASHGVPEDLAALPLVESGYQLEASSHAGAVGMWQFTRGTGRRFLHIDHVVDERRDPLLATEAAAKYLRENYESLGTWPLAITAYNHGANGMGYAVRKLGTTNLATIAARYRSKYFGFASRNFYSEFLAARDIMARADEHCPGVEAKPLNVARVEIDAYVELADLADCADSSVNRLMEANPALQPDVASGKLLVPRGYRLNLPSKHARQFEVAYAKLPAASRSHGQRPYYAMHRVRRGQTLSEIAHLYRTSVATLQYHNDIRDPRRLRYGQVLKVPVGVAAVPAAKVASSKASYVTHRVARGQTLSRIADRYGISTAVLQRYNGIGDPRKLRYGQVIKIPTGVAAVRAASARSYQTHRVGRGQTLSHIARLYRTTVSALQSYNGISDPRKLRYGQVIKIPM
jgi:membrane-bound lytic murein transglycosylase D